MFEDVIFGLNKDKDLKMGKTLATASIKAALDGPVVMFAKQNEKSPGDKNRFTLAYAIANSAFAKIAVNLVLQVNIQRKTRILDHMADTFLQILSRNSGRFDISRFVVSDEEISYTQSRGLTSSEVDMRELLDLLYDRRMEAYEAAITQGFDPAQNADGAQGPFSMLIKIFGNHIYGDNTAEDILFITELSDIIYENVNWLMEYVKNTKP